MATSGLISVSHFLSRLVLVINWSFFQVVHCRFLLPLASPPCNQSKVLRKMFVRKLRGKQDFFPIPGSSLTVKTSWSLFLVLLLFAIKHGNKKSACLLTSYCTNQQEFSRAMDQSHPMKDFAADLVAKATVTSTPRSSLLRNNSDVSLDDVGDDRCFTLTKALGYHVIYGRLFYLWVLPKKKDCGLPIFSSRKHDISGSKAKRVDHLDAEPVLWSLK